MDMGVPRYLVVLLFWTMRCFFIRWILDNPIEQVGQTDRLAENDLGHLASSVASPLTTIRPMARANPMLLSKV